MLDLSGLQRAFAGHPAADLLCAVAAAALAVAAFRLRARPALAAPCLAGIALALGLPMAADAFLHHWDERYHALVARTLFAHPLHPALFEPLLGGPSDALNPAGAFDWPLAPVWLHKPPLALWLMALGRAALGPGELALRVPSLLLHAAAVPACAALGPLLFGEERGRAAGLWAALLYATNGELLSLAAGRVPTDHPDSALISLITIGALFAVRAGRAVAPVAEGAKQSVISTPTGATTLALLAGALSGAAVLAKSFPGLATLGVLAAALPWRLARGAAVRTLLLALSACAAVALPWTLWTRYAFPEQAAHEAASALRHLTEVFEEHRGGLLFHLQRLPQFFGEASPLALLWLLWRGRPHAPAGRVLLVWIAGPYALFTAAATKMDAYPLVAAAPLCLCVGATLAAWMPHLEDRSLQVSTRATAALLCAALVVLPLRFTFSDCWRPFERDRGEIARADRYRRLAARLGPGPGLLHSVDRPVEAMFYTGWLALDRAPTAAEEAAARARGWRVEGP